MQTVERYLETEQALVSAVRLVAESRLVLFRGVSGTSQIEEQEAGEASRSWEKASSHTLSVNSLTVGPVEAA